MSAMSASPVKPPVLPPSGVNVPPPVATTPPKVGIPSTLTIAPSKPANMNHTAMPLSLIADHKMAAQFPPAGPPPPALQPISQPLPRTIEKPKELSAPPLLMKPTSNGVEGLITPLQAPTPVPVVPEAPVPAASTPPAAPTQKPEPPVPVEVPDGKQTLPEKSSEPSVAAAAPSVVDREIEKKEEVGKPEEPVSEPSNPPVSAPVAPPPPAAVPEVAPPTSTPTPPPTIVAATPPPAEQPLPPTVTPSVSRTESTIPHAKPELKVATIPRQAAKRKREPKVEPVTPEVKKEGKDDDRKSKRVRLPTQPYQSPLPELNIIAKINKSTKSTPSKAADDKLIVFYKNEFLAVRNAEGGFYVCQAMQNIYKSSPRIRIRWLSQEDGKDTYSPDFYDHTDFDCILTNLNLDKVDKERFRLPPVEQQRTESILKRALDVEKGVSEKPPVTEEHPDGLDLSLFRDESQLKQSKGKKSDGGETDSENDEDDDGEEDEEEEKKTKLESAPKSSKKKKKSAKKKPPAEKKSTAKSASVSNKTTVQPSKKKTETRVGSKRKSSVGSNSQPAEKKVKKSDSSSQPSDRTNKTRSAGAVAAVREKSRRDRRAKSRK